MPRFLVATTRTINNEFAPAVLIYTEVGFKSYVLKDQSTYLYEDSAIECANEIIKQMNDMIENIILKYIE